MSSPELSAITEEPLVDESTIHPPSGLSSHNNPLELSPVTEQPPVGIAARPMNQPMKSKVHKQRWNLAAIVRDVIKQNRREKPLADAPGVRDSIRAIFKTSWLNMSLILIPLSWIFHFLKLNNTLIFVFSFLAIIPLAKLIGFATEELSLRFGQNLAHFLKVTLGNLVELIFAIIALVNCQLTVAQFSLVGSFLSNLLLVLGMCFFAGGTRFSEQGFGISTVHLNSSLMILSVIAVLLPVAFNSAVHPSDSDPLTDAQEGHDILSISHGVAVILLFIYLCYMVFQFFSHKHLYGDHDHCPELTEMVPYSEVMAKRLRIQGRSVHPALSSLPPGNGTMGHLTIDVGSLGVDWKEDDDDDEEDKPQMGLITAITLLGIVTVILGITTSILVNSIGSLTSNGNINGAFVGLIISPVAGNIVDYAEYVMSSAKDKLEQTVNIAVGSSIQMALFVIPFIVVLGWILGKPLTLLFDSFLSVVLFLTVFIVNIVLQDGKTNWLKGMILICLYTIIAFTIWYYPASDPAGLLATCI